MMPACFDAFAPCVDDVSQHLDETQLLDAALDAGEALSAVDRAHLQTCQACAEGVELARSLLNAAPNAAKTTATSSVIRRLDSSLDRLERYSPLAASLGGVLEISANEARRFLHTIDDPTPWEPGWVPGSSYRLIDAKGPALKDAQAILVRLAPGAMVPEHLHHGEERCLVIDGLLIDGGQLHSSGAVLIAATDTIHSISVPPNADCTCVIVNVGSIEVLDDAAHSPPVAL